MSCIPEKGQALACVDGVLGAVSCERVGGGWVEGSAASGTRGHRSGGDEKGGLGRGRGTELVRAGGETALDLRRIALITTPCVEGGEGRSTSRSE